MIICPIEGAVLFADCPVNTCMWNNGGRCKNGIRDSRIPKNMADCTPAQLDAMLDVKQTVTVGLFLEAHAGKEISNLKQSDIPTKLDFETWAAKRKLNISAIDFNSVVYRILKNL